MKLVTYRSSAASEGRLGAIHDGLIIDVEALGTVVGEDFPATMLDLIDQGPDALAALARAIAETDGSRPAGISLAQENARLLAPIPRPRKNIFGIGLNYVEHVAESAKSLDTSADLPDKPVVFSKPPTSVIADGEPIQHNAAMTQMLDWEVELGVIIGKRATRIAKDDAMSHVFGYTVINDISARDNRRAGQWIFSKGQDSYCPMGPAIVTADEVADPHDLTLWLKKNGEEKQRSNTQAPAVRHPDADRRHFLGHHPGARRHHRHRNPGRRRRRPGPTGMDVARRRDRMRCRRNWRSAQSRHQDRGLSRGEFLQDRADRSIVEPDDGARDPRDAARPRNHPAGTLLVPFQPDADEEGHPPRNWPRWTATATVARWNSAMPMSM